MPLSDGMDIHFTSLHKILRNLYDQMTPLTDDIATFATAVAGLGALLYISYRVWQALARADAIDVFSLLRPFVIGLCIIGFRPIVVNSINGILKPLVVGTNHILKDQLLDLRTSKEERPFGMGGSCTPQDIRRNRPERGLRRRIAGAGAGCSYAKCHGYAV